MSRWRSRLILCVCSLACAGIAQAQTQVLDFDALGTSYGFGLVSRDKTEFIYTRNVAGSDPNTLHAVSLTNPGAARVLPTAGIDVDFFRLDRFNGRGIVTDFVNRGVFSVDFAGGSAPIPLSAEPGRSGILSPASGQVAMFVSGNASSTNAADRDQLYTRSILGGPATEVTGGIPQSRQITEVIFAEDGQRLLVGTKILNDNFVPQTSKLYLATPGATGLTPVLGSLSAETRFIPLGSDSTGEHFVTLTDTTVTDMWTVPTSNPAQAKRLNLNAQGERIYIDHELLDTAGDRVFISSQRAIWSVPTDGSSLPQMLGQLPQSENWHNIQEVVGENWLYVRTNETPTSAESRAYAIPLTGGSPVEFRDPGHIDVNHFSIAPDGESVLFSDGRTAGNDLYLGRPGDAVPMTTLLDVPNTDRLVRAMYSLDGKYAIVALVQATVTATTIADRLLAVPIEGGMPITIDDGTVGPLKAQISNGGISPQLVTDNRIFYLKGFADGQAGFYVADLPSDVEGDFNGDAHVDAADYTVWRNTLNQEGEGLAADANGDEMVDELDYGIWKQNYGAGGAGGSAAFANGSVPEPGCLAMLTVALMSGSLRRPVRRCLG